MSLNSLDRVGVRLLSPCGSQILPKPACRCRWVRADDATKLRRSSMKILSFVLFRSSWSVVEPSWDDRGSSIWGCLLLFWFRSRTYECTLIDVWFICVLCEVAIVSQLCISFPYVLHGLCEDYLTCDIAFNAVMPLSRASTRGRYSHIEGVTGKLIGNGSVMENYSGCGSSCNSHNLGWHRTSSNSSM